MRDPATVSGALVRRLDALWSWIAAMSGPSFVVGLVVLTVARTGLGMGGSEGMLRFARSFPEPVPSWRANSVVGPALAHVLGVADEQAWRVVHALVIVAAVAVVAACLRSRLPGAGDRRVVAVWLTFTTVPAAILQKVGSYDPYTVIGTALVVLPRRAQLPLAIVGGALVGATNAEQGMVALVGALVLASLLPMAEAERRAQRIGLVTGMAAVVVARIGVLAWFAASEVEVHSRGDVFSTYLDDSLGRAAGAGGTGVYGWLGASWLLVGFGVVLLAASVQRRARWWVGLVAGVGLLPALATVTTFDGTRVFAMVTFASVLVGTCWIVEHAEGDWGVALRRLTAAVVLVSPILPVVLSDPTGEAFFVFPWAR